MQIPTSQTIILINFFRYLQSIYFNQLLCRGSVLSKIIHSILQIYRVNIFHKKSSVTTDIHNKDTRGIYDHAALRNDRCICLRKNHNLINYNTKRLFFIDEIDCAILFEVVGKLILKHTVVLGRKTYRQLNLFKRCVSACRFQFLCDGDKGKDEISLIVGFVLHIVQTLTAERPELTAIFQNLIGHGWLHRMLGESGNEGMIYSFDGKIAMVNCD